MGQSRLYRISHTAWPTAALTALWSTSFPVYGGHGEAVQLCVLSHMSQSPDV